MHNPVLREKAVRLRLEEGLSIDELAERLGLSRTTIYHWVRGMPLAVGKSHPPPAGAGTAAMQAAFRAKRETAYAAGAAEFHTLADEPGFRDFVCMYIGEGYKRRRHTVSLANSDPAVIVLAARWIRRFARNPVWYAVQYHADQDLDELRRFWSELLSVRPDDVRLQRKSNSNGLAGRKWRSRHGVLTVGSDDTLFRARLQAWIDIVERSWV